MPFADIPGQDRPVKIMQRMLASGTIPHALLFTGISGIGKHATALAFAKALNCAQCSRDFCGTCSSCKKIHAGTHPDIIQIAPQKNVIKIDQIRSLQHNIAFAPLEAGWRAVIIDHAESMNKETANCLLKTLEEPPAATVLILVAHGSAGLLPTVLSRCQKFVFAPLSKNAVEAQLINEGTPCDQARQVAAHAHGSMQRARQLLDDSLTDEFNSLASMVTGPCAVEERLAFAAALGKSPERASAVLVRLLEWLRDIVLCRNGAEAKHLYNAAQYDRIMLAARTIEPHTLDNKIMQVRQLMNARNDNTNMQLGLESLLFS